MSAAAEPYTGRERAVPCAEPGCRREAWANNALCDRHNSSVVRVESAFPLDGNAAAACSPRVAAATSPEVES